MKTTFLVKKKDQLCPSSSIDKDMHYDMQRLEFEPGHPTT